MSKSKIKTHKIKIKEKVTLTENLLNYKRWFNGLKKFSSLKINPPKILQ